MTRDFPKAYNPGVTEKKWYEFWQKAGLYKADNKSDKQPYSILMPPPNVTGILHFGHVLNITLQDLYIRWKRMNGYECCWFPGTDHAGIATQTKVEAMLREQGYSRYDLGREKFIEKVWEWRNKYGGIILQQLRELGISCDWDRTLFTMDESASNAVQEVFIRLFDMGLIYKGKRIINWSPLGMTALSDEEVEYKSVNEKLYTLKYFFENSEEFLAVSTVRTETIFGDIAVAVNPNDERYKDKIGLNVVVPIVGRVVPVIADEHADPEFGTGCVKITPAHDPNDFIVGEKHDLEMINTINPDGTLNEETGEFNGLERYKARKLISKKLEDLELIESVKDYNHNIGFSQRGGEPVEPYLSDQWFVKMKPLAEIALEAIQKEKVIFYPNHWVKTYEHWMNNIRDWCISRQLWWGHRIPVYYAENGDFTAAPDENAAREKLGLAKNANLIQDEDVLDTWFSSWLWPMTTMKWLADSKTESTDDLNKFLPTELLVTAPDIIFFWVARMIMATKLFKKEIPFRNVYFTSTIRDGQGKKLSKSLGNSPDPLNIIEKYGADAVRFTMIYLSPLGQDIRMNVDVKNQDVPSVELGRNFANKIWNAGRFLMMKNDNFNGGNKTNESVNDLEPKELTFADKWILSRFNTTIIKLNEALENYKVNEYSKVLYDYIWRDFCDWYVEILKVQTNRENGSDYNRSLMKFALVIYDGILKLLHPVMPFLTEEIWHLTDDRNDDESISLQAPPEPDLAAIDMGIEEKFEHVQMIVDEIRSLRAASNIPPHEKISVSISVKDDITLEYISDQSAVIESLARCKSINTGLNLEKPEGSLTSVVRETEIFLELAGSIDIEAEKDRLGKEIKRLERNISISEKKLSNEKFVNNAPENVVSHEREKLDSMKGSLEKIRNNLRSLDQS